LSRMFSLFKGRPSKPVSPKQENSGIFHAKYSWFKELLESNTQLLNIMSDVEEKLQGRQIFGMTYIRAVSTRAVFHAFRMVKCLNILSDNKDLLLYDVLKQLNEKIKEVLGKKKEIPAGKYILHHAEVTKEMVDWVGGKSANLGEVYNRAKLPVPQGFAITTRAFEDFFTHNDLFSEIAKKKMEIDPDAPKTIGLVSDEIQRAVLSAEIPKDIEEAIHAAYKRLVEEAGRPFLRVSMRSSAIGEDSDLSFAGQYVSALNVPFEKLSQTYKYIVASLYTPRAISYRLAKGIPDDDIAMSVACLKMVESEASGVMYSRDPLNLLEQNIMITAVWGLGPYAVGGVVTPDNYRVSRENFDILESRVSRKLVRLVNNPYGGLKETAVPIEKQDHPCLSDMQIKTLAGYALTLEEKFGCPQDIEWALDDQGRLIILQTRPLRVGFPKDGAPVPGVPRLAGYSILIEGGSIAFPGVGIGPAFHVHTEEDLDNFPDGAVLVSAHSSPQFMVVMQKARAIVTDAGSITGHMASLVREFGVPTILDTKTATTAIAHGEQVTVDAYSGRIYQGNVPELLTIQTDRKPQMRDTPVHLILKRIAELIIPLHLLDPGSPDFNARSCRSLHDITRLVHERSYEEMFQISDLVSYEHGGALKLDAPIPLDLYMIDLEGGVTQTRKHAKKAAIDEITSVPFKALLRGMMHKELQCREPRPIQFRGFLSVMTEQMLSAPANSRERFGDRSYAIISDKYLNFSSRVGYHYSVLDSYCGKTINKNYITFAFKGGAADDVRRNRRARAIAMILESIGFSVEVTGDRVSARFQKYDSFTIEEKLDLVGRLLQFTRQMDMLMSNEASVREVAKAFLDGNYKFEQCT